MTLSLSPAVTKGHLELNNINYNYEATLKLRLRHSYVKQYCTVARLWSLDMINNPAASGRKNHYLPIRCCYKTL